MRAGLPLQQGTCCWCVGQVVSAQVCSRSSTMGLDLKPHSPANLAVGCGPGTLLPLLLGSLGLDARVLR